MTTTRKPRARLYLSSDTRQIIDNLRPMTGLDATAIITRAVGLLHARKPTFPMKEATDCQKKEYLLSLDTLAQIEAEGNRIGLGESKGKVVDMAVLFYSRHAKALRKAELESQLATLNAS